jgi:hypothetical protein
LTEVRRSGIIVNVSTTFSHTTGLSEGGYMSPIDWKSLRSRRSMVRGHRGPLASVYMKTVRLAWPADAIYWLSVLHAGGAGGFYLRRRVFRSGGEDNLDVDAIQACERLLEAPADLPEGGELEALCRATYAVTLGTKWYELADGQEYVRTQARAAELSRDAKPRTRDPHKLLAAFVAAVDRGDLLEAYRCLYEERALKIPKRPFYDAAITAGLRSGHPDVRELAAMLNRQQGWLEALDDRHYLRQVLWTAVRGPFSRTHARAPSEADYARAAAAAAKRLRREIEPIPGWARDGIHVSGSDPRLAGDEAGRVNMCEMYLRDGVLDPARPGVSRHARGKSQGLWERS